MRLGTQQRNPEFLKLQREHTVVKNPNGRQRRCQLLHNSAKNPTAI